MSTFSYGYIFFGDVYSLDFTFMNSNHLDVSAITDKFTSNYSNNFNCNRILEDMVKLVSIITCKVNLSVETV